MAVYFFLCTLPQLVVLFFTRRLLLETQLENKLSSTQSYQLLAINSRRGHITALKVVFFPSCPHILFHVLTTLYIDAGALPEPDPSRFRVKSHLATEIVAPLVEGPERKSALPSAVTDRPPSEKARRRGRF